MTFRAVIFDLDGTLLDTLQDISDSMNAVLRSHGWPEHDRETYRTWVGDGAENLVLRAIPEAARTPEAVREGVRAYREEYERRWASNTRPYPGVAELLDGFLEKGFSLAVLSNKGEEFTQTMVRGLLARWGFRDIRGARPGSPLKPDPSAAFQVAANLGVDPSECLFFGDSGLDMETARRAGMFGIGVLWGFRGPEELAQAGARLLVKDPRSFVPFIP